MAKTAVRTKKQFLWTVIIGFALFSFFPVFDFPAGAESLLNLKGEETRYNIYSELKVLEDPTGELELDDVRSSPWQERFESRQKKTPNFAYTSSAYWFQLDIQDLSGGQDWVLEIGYPLLQDVQFFYPGDRGSYNRVQTGALYPYDSRPIQNRKFVFPLPSINPEETFSIFLRTETAYAHIVPLQIWERESFHARTSREYIVQGIYYGMVLIMGLYNLFFLFFSRDIRYLLYVLYIVSIALFHMSLNGLSFEFFWPQQPIWGSRSILVFGFASTFFLFLFAFRILQLPRQLPVFSRIFIGVAGFSLLMIPVALLVNYTPAMQIKIATASIAAAILVIAVVLSWKKGLRPARFLFLAWVFLAGGTVLLMGRSLGIFPHGFLTMSGIQIGSGLEMIFLSLSMAEYTKILGQEKEEATELARLDELTGLFNRRALLDIGQKQLDLCRAGGNPLAVVMVDIDDFKEINDCHGHEGGDRFLKQVARALKSQVREADCVGRFGGDEFLIFLASAGAGTARTMVEKMRKYIEKEQVTLSGGEKIQVSCSFGVALLQEEKELTELIQRADNALFMAKREGRNRVVLVPRHLEKST